MLSALTTSPEETERASGLAVSSSLVARFPGSLSAVISASDVPGSLSKDMT